MERPNNVIIMNCSSIREFFEQWTYWLYPIHEMSPAERQVAARFLEKRYELSRIILDQNLLDKNLFSEDTKREIREDMGLTVNNFNRIVSILRKKGVIIEEAERTKSSRPPMLNPKFIPSYDEQQNNFQLLLYWRNTIDATEKDGERSVLQEQENI